MRRWLSVLVVWIWALPAGATPVVFTDAAAFDLARTEGFTLGESWLLLALGACLGVRRWRVHERR